MLEIPVLRWGKPYESLQQDPVVHFESGETLCSVHQANGGLIQMDLRKQQRARDVLREIPIATLVEMCKKAADLYLTATFPWAMARSRRRNSARCSRRRPDCPSTCARPT